MTLLAGAEEKSTTARTLSPVPPEVRWLSHDEQVTWRSFLFTVQLLLERLDRQSLRESGMVLTHYEMLIQLSKAPDRSLRMSELAERSLSSRSRVSHAVARMQERGWVRRQACPTDGRGHIAVLTDEGFSLLQTAAPSHAEMVRGSVLDHLGSEQVGQLREISLALFDHLVSTGDVFPLGGTRNQRRPSSTRSVS